MKKLLPLLLCALCAVPSFGQRLNGPRYRGFVDGTFIKGNDGIYEDFNMQGGGFTTTHGFQFNRYIFVGGGVGYYYVNRDPDPGDLFWCPSTEHDYAFKKETYNVVPVYADFRVHMARSRVSPFFDAKVGASISNDVGFFASPSFGLRVGIKDNLGVNITLGYTVMSGLYQEYYDTPCYTHSMNISLGIDF